MFKLIIGIILIINCKGHIIKYNSIIDLTHALDSSTPLWNANESFAFSNQKAEDTASGGWYATNSFTTSEHGGTHLDAPYHFSKAGWKLTDIPPCHWIAEGVLIDVKSKVGDNGDFELLPEHLEEWETKNGNIPEHSVILVNFGWASKYGSNRVSYFGSELPPYKFPGISKAAAEWIVKNGKIIGVGVDSPSMDSGKSKTYDAHKIFADANLYGLENVALNGTNLPEKGFDLIILPIKIQNGTGGPVRILAVY